MLRVGSGLSAPANICYEAMVMSQYPVPIPDVITSTANQEVKRLRAMHERKYRKQTGWFLAEGMRICHEAVALGWDMHRLAFVAGREDDRQVKQLLTGLLGADGRALPMTEKLLQKISRKDNPQMVLGAFGQRWDHLDAIAPMPSQFWVALDRVRDPGNLGTVMRTADAVGASGIILIGDCTDPYSVEAVRASMGAVFNMRLIACSEEQFLQFATRWPGQIIGTALPAAVDYQCADYEGPLVMVMGNEQAGLTKPLMQACSQLIKIPMQGRSDSLNLAVATGVALYAAYHQRLA